MEWGLAAMAAATSAMEEKVTKRNPLNFWLARSHMTSQSVSSPHYWEQFLRLSSEELCGSVVSELKLSVKFMNLFDSYLFSLQWNRFQFSRLQINSLQQKFWQLKLRETSGNEQRLNRSSPAVQTSTVPGIAPVGTSPGAWWCSFYLWRPWISLEHLPIFQKGPACKTGQYRILYLPRAVINHPEMQTIWLTGNCQQYCIVENLGKHFLIQMVKVSISSHKPSW